MFEGSCEIAWCGVQKQLREDFLIVAELAETNLQRGDIRIETLQKPHKPPSKLPKGMMAVYVFSETNRVLKVGKVGWRSQARYTSQHYNPRSALSTLAASLLGDKDVVHQNGLTDENVSAWIKENTYRVNFILDAKLGMRTLTLLEAFVQCRLQPVFEGFASQC